MPEPAPTMTATLAERVSDIRDLRYQGPYEVFEGVSGHVCGVLEVGIITRGRCDAETVGDGAGHAGDVAGALVGGIVENALKPRISPQLDYEGRSRW